MDCPVDGPADALPRKSDLHTPSICHFHLCANPPGSACSTETSERLCLRGFEVVGEACDFQVPLGQDPGWKVRNVLMVVMVHGRGSRVEGCRLDSSGCTWLRDGNNVKGARRETSNLLLRTRDGCIAFAVSSSCARATRRVVSMLTVSLLCLCW